MLYLLPLADELMYRLDKANRLGWVEEECQRLEQLRHPPQEPLDTAFRRIRGWESLNPRQAAVLQELYAFRDGKACVWDLPPTIAASNDDLLRIAQGDGAAPRGIGGLLANRCYGELVEAIDRGLQNPEVPRPARPDNIADWTPERRGRLSRLKSWRSDYGHGLGWRSTTFGRPPAWSASHCIRPACPESWPAGRGKCGRWQLAEFGDSLAELARDNGW